MAEYIEREAVIDLFKHMGTPVEMAIKEIPAADVFQVVHGRWIFDHMTGERSYYARCSNCNRMRFFERKENEPLFCDMCGTKMDKEETDG